MRPVMSPASTAHAIVDATRTAKGRPRETASTHSIVGQRRSYALLNGTVTDSHV